MLAIYRRHLQNCAHRAKGRAYDRCLCPLWADGLLKGEGEIRVSLKTNEWETAQKKVREWEANGSRNAPAPEPAEALATIAQVQKEFTGNAEKRMLKKSSIERYKIIFRQMNQWAQGEGIRFLSELDTRALTRFRATWKGNSGLADLKKLERLRAFCKFAVLNGYLEKNPAEALENPKIRPNPTLPFSPDEMLKILSTVAQRISEREGPAKVKAMRLRALVLLLRYTGLRISDAVGCSVDRIQDGKLWLYTAKTGQHVNVPLPPFVVKELTALPCVSPKYFFWAGLGTVETARKKWTEALADIFTAAKVHGGHAHRFRDTFAVELLKAGTPIERVSILLGHSSVKITEKHYNPWNSARQEQTEADVMRSWASDSVAILENSPGYTDGYTEKSQFPNSLKTQ